MGANQMRLLGKGNSPAYLTSSISAVDRYPWICSQTALSPTDCQNENGIRQPIAMGIGFEEGLGSDVENATQLY
jgi:hypothetical protein